MFWWMPRSLNNNVAQLSMRMHTCVKWAIKYFLAHRFMSGCKAIVNYQWICCASYEWLPEQLNRHALMMNCAVRQWNECLEAMPFALNGIRTFKLWVTEIKRKTVPNAKNDSWKLCGNYFHQVVITCWEASFYHWGSVLEDKD